MVFECNKVVVTIDAVLLREISLFQCAVHCSLAHFDISIYGTFASTTCDKRELAKTFFHWIYNFNVERKRADKETKCTVKFLGHLQNFEFNVNRLQ